MKKKNIGVTEDEYNEDTSDKPKKITKGNDMKRNLFAEEKDEKGSDQSSALGSLGLKPKPAV